MHLKAAVLSLLPVALAQYDYGSSSGSSSATSATSTSSSSSSLQTVAVGQNGFKFSPDSLTVVPGKKVVFQFFSGGHSVTQGDFNNPCQPSNSSAFFSGFVNSNNQFFTVTVNSSDPIWLYCAAPGHCQGGMVAVINPPSSGQTLDQFRSAAAGSKGSNAPSSVQGGDLGAPPSSSSSGSSSSSTPTSGAAAPGNGWTTGISGGLLALFGIALF